MVKIWNHSKLTIGFQDDISGGDNMSDALSYGQLEWLWINAGGSQSMAPLMAAIALAESSGIPDNNNYTDNGGTQTSWGLWQISNGTHDMPVANIDDPYVNAQQAVIKYQSQGLDAWGTYTSDAYQQFYQTGVSPVAYNGTGGGTVVTTGKTKSNPNPSQSSSNGYSIWSGVWGGIEGYLHLFQPSAIEHGIENPPANPLSGISDIATALKVGVNDFEQFMQWSSWLFAPSSWLRIGAFFVGLASFGAAIYMFKEAL
jgi:hypothetical protein